MFGVRVLIVLGCLALSLFGQAPEFNAASIRPNNFAGGSRAEGPGGGYLKFAPGRVTSGSSTGVSVRRLILEAYHLSRFQLSGGPAWIDSDRFTLDARADDTSANESQLRAMLQTLLARRFSLTVHRGGTAPMPAYALVVSKNGPGPALQEMKDGVHFSKEQEDRLKIATRLYGGRKNHFLGTAQTMQVLVDRLNAFESLDEKTVDRPVLDKTGLQGLYYWAVFWDEGEDFMTMVQEELGLKFEAQKASIDALVIDYVERPNEN